ncbi:glycosyltransferase [Sphingomonas abietis]|uniref:Glycosyltransferase n=1 Tax=Sphingomonas abietis TaxID=3012344 RepID=A0ABY7NKK4_9SPHN|nr:glycosyltransferase [Sphingomonas abietis]WBO22059.1 glycosyltransferase [Sphingomonas abietis]
MPVRILHLHSTFALGGKEARAVRLMNAFGDRAEHVVLSAVPGALGARDAIDPAIAVTFPGEGEAPSLIGRPGPRRYWHMARYMAGFDLVLSYNWGAMDGVAARRLYAGMMRLPPLVHHEDGFNADEWERQKPARMLFRRAMLGAAHRLVVPSERLEKIARRDWHQPARHIRRIANGIPLERYGVPAADAIPGFRRAPGDVVVGTLAGLRAVKNLPRLVRGFARSGAGGRLVIVGEGPERDAILATAQSEGVADRLLLPGFLADPSRYVGHFDIFALASDSEQFPISLIEAMAAGLPVVSTDVGDVRSMVSQENRRYIVPVADDAGFADAIGRLVANRDVRHRLGSANRTLAWSRYGEAAMIADYAALYGEAIGRPALVS